MSICKDFLPPFPGAFWILTSKARACARPGCCWRVHECSDVLHNETLCQKKTSCKAAWIFEFLISLWAWDLLVLCRNCCWRCDLPWMPSITFLWIHSHWNTGFAFEIETVRMSSETEQSNATMTGEVEQLLQSTQSTPLRSPDRWPPDIRFELRKPAFDYVKSISGASRNLPNFEIREKVPSGCERALVYIQVQWTLRRMSLLHRARSWHGREEAFRKDFTIAYRHFERSSQCWFVVSLKTWGWNGGLWLAGQWSESSASLTAPQSLGDNPATHFPQKGRGKAWTEFGQPFEVNLLKNQQTVRLNHREQESQSRQQNMHKTIRANTGQGPFSLHRPWTAHRQLGTAWGIVSLHLRGLAKTSFSSSRRGSLVLPATMGKCAHWCDGALQGVKQSTGRGFQSCQ